MKGIKEDKDKKLNLFFIPFIPFIQANCFFFVFLSRPNSKPRPPCVFGVWEQAAPHRVVTENIHQP